jgi:hypothetical protein
VHDRVLQAEVAVADARLLAGGMLRGSHSINRSKAAISSVFEASYWLIQRLTCRSK